MKIFERAACRCWFFLGFCVWRSTYCRCEACNQPSCVCYNDDEELK